MPIAGEGEAEAWQPCNGKTMKDGDDQPEIASLNSHPFAGSETSLSCWCQVGMTGGVGSPSLTAEARRGSKGAVLVDASAGEQAPQGVWEFEAEVVLLPGGHWPPRGLISGRWPPVESQRVAASSSSSDASCSTACPFLKAGGAAPGRSEGVATPAAPLDEGCTREQRRRRKVKQRRMSKYTHVIHSLATRQAATVIRVQELGDAVEAGRDMPPSVAAAEVMLRSQCAGGNGGCLARVRFQFVHHPDWLLRGARLLVRDRTTGHLAATGVVSNLCQGKKAS